MNQKTKYILFIILCSLSCTRQNIVKNPPNDIDDKIVQWINKSENKKTTLFKRKQFIDSAYSNVLKLKNDSIKNKYLIKVAYLYYKLNDSLLFKKVNKEARSLATRRRDTLNIAETYWDMASFYYHKNKMDSAYYNYYKAQKLYENAGDDFYSARMLLNMAIMQSDMKDYTGSEVTTTKAISLLKPLKKYKQLYMCYNNLGIVFNNLQDYERAIFYHQKALEYLKKTDNRALLEPSALNNIGVVYENQKNYKKAVKNYKKALDYDSLFHKDPELYAMLIDNLGYSKFLSGDTIESPKLFYKALKIRDSLRIIPGITVNKLHLAEYYASRSDTTKSIRYAIQSKELAENSQNYRDLLTAIKWLSKLDRNNAQTYMRTYVKVNDSLLREERTIRNKFARIRFETDEFIEETERLNQKVITISIALIGTILIAILLYVIKRQKDKNRQLYYEQQQQKASEEIYNLLLNQQVKVEEGKQKEKQRISRELHDGILGKLFGIRLSLDSLNVKNDKASIKTRKQYLNSLKETEEEIRSISHEMNAEFLNSNTNYAAIIANLVKSQNKISEFNILLHHDRTIKWDAIAGNIKMNIYRVIQEALQNCNKHANANEVIISFKKKHQALELTVEDDGIGFGMKKNKKGIGLKNIRSRVESLSGKLVVDSTKGTGTTLIIKIPLQ